MGQQGIEWHFTPPYAPNFGGLWEATVKSCKGHLKRVIGENFLTYEELITLVIQIEGCLNSRPLGYLSSNEEDPIALTPGHFLIGSA
uniref:Integrase catalytic domain-containing protein n=1 Tax=Trichogramma kaykai TaxID=54128 RepID=A0ABD2WKH1_9HYME